jgi:hypothetical protein
MFALAEWLYLCLFFILEIFINYLIVKIENNFYICETKQTTMIRYIKNLFKDNSEKEQFIKLLIENNINCWNDFENSNSDIKKDIEKISESLGINTRLFISSDKEIKEYLQELEYTEDYEKCTEALIVMNIKKDIK